MSLAERGRLQVKRERLAGQLGKLERALGAAKPSERVGIEIGIEALRKAMADLTHRIGELGGK